MTLNEFQSILYRIFLKEGQPILVVSDAGGYRGDVTYHLEIGMGRIKTDKCSSLEELASAVGKAYPA